VPCAPPSRRVWGEYPCAETQARPGQGPYGESKAKRPDLQHGVLSTRCVDRALPMWGTPDDGHASDKPRQTTLVSEIAPLLAPYGVPPGASLSMAAAALVPADHLTARRDPWGMPRLPAPDSACGRGMAEAVAHHRWEVVGVLAQTPPPPPRPGTCSTVAEARVPLSGKASRAVVVHASRQDQRRQQHLERASRASEAPLEATGREAARQAACCQADAAAAAGQLRALQSAYPGVAVGRKKRPTAGPGRPHATQPRVGTARRDGLPGPRHARSEGMARQTPASGGGVLLTQGPTAGELPQRAGDVLRAYKAPQGMEQNDGCWQAPRIVQSLLLQKPERIEALGLVFLVALLRWRRGERPLRVPVETMGHARTGVGHAGHAAAASLHAEDPVCRREGEQSRGATPTRPPAVDRPTAIPRGATGPCHLLDRSREWGTSARCWQELGPNGPQGLSQGARG